MTRRGILGALAALPLLGCTPRPAPTPPLPSLVGECTTLDPRGVSPLTGSCRGSRKTSGVEEDAVPTFWVGPMVVRGEEVIAAAFNRLLAFDLASGRPTRVLAARRNANPAWAARGDVAVVPRCDGALIVSRGGCVTHELHGHAPVIDLETGDGITGLAFVGEDLVSAGADGTLRRWSVDDGRELARVAIDPRATGMTVAGDDLVVSWPDHVSLRRGADLAESQRRAVPDVVTAWQMTADGRLVCTRDDYRRSAVVVVAPDGGAREFPTNRWPLGVAVGARGEVVWVDGDRLRLLAPDGTLTERALDLPTNVHTAWRCALSDDGSVLLVSEATKGMWAFDVATGARRTTFVDPRRG